MLQMYLLYNGVIIDIKKWVWRGRILTLFDTHSWQFSFREMADIAYLINHYVFSLRFFCNGVFLLHEHQIIKHHSIWCSLWSGVEVCMQKVGFMPQPFRHGPRNWLLSSSTAMLHL